ncbi:Sulfotransferase domain-containing protein [Lentibacillus halodurans]|uniref:Sulfotransferase domain-containing protein n=1 Tax=Lentibacillus halodurans TaxID=237679 RepID=A0A1I0XM10_9BACI|nr:sulfotransferase [Lentibacillus halodurans]SFB01013.1 Sulfotransferase domain-containing protein [Lentibacillus halodurans]
MVLPNFLGLGAQRAGSTWLYNHLINHPDIYMPCKRKEIHFFDRYYEKGVNWYEGFFYDGYKNIGEITPNYLYEPEIPLKIYNLIPECKFIVILRNPVDRAFSQYLLAVRDKNEKRDFKMFLNNRSDVFKRGLYFEQLERYFSYFDKEQFLILIFEEVMDDPDEALGRIGEFLKIDGREFDTSQVGERVNESYNVKFSKPYSIAKKLGSKLRDNDMDLVVNIAKNLNIKKLFGKENSKMTLSVKEKKELYYHYKVDIEKLELLLDKNLALWKME